MVSNLHFLWNGRFGILDVLLYVNVPYIGRAIHMKSTEWLQRCWSLIFWTARILGVKPSCSLNEELNPVKTEWVSDDAGYLTIITVLGGNNSNNLLQPSRWPQPSPTEATDAGGQVLHVLEDALNTHSRFLFTTIKSKEWLLISFFPQISDSLLDKGSGHHSLEAFPPHQQLLPSAFSLAPLTSGRGPALTLAGSRSYGDLGPIASASRDRDCYLATTVIGQEVGESRLSGRQRCQSVVVPHPNCDREQHQQSLNRERESRYIQGLESEMILLHRRLIKAIDSPVHLTDACALHAYLGMPTVTYSTFQSC